MNPARSIALNAPFVFLPVFPLLPRRALIIGGLEISDVWDNPFSSGSLLGFSCDFLPVLKFCSFTAFFLAANETLAVFLFSFFVSPENCAISPEAAFPAGSTQPFDLSLLVSLFGWAIPFRDFMSFVFVFEAVVVLLFAGFVDASTPSSKPSCCIKFSRRVAFSSSVCINICARCWERRFFISRVSTIFDFALLYTISAASNSLFAREYSLSAESILFLNILI
mmetsp:Transcript_23064/g.34346  ORF Transcript_23064/g.34346 Transcript_23064/m.34346 type:complete len:223 (-) Transcript_23064:3325-3993(-)